MNSLFILTLLAFSDCAQGHLHDITAGLAVSVDGNTIITVSRRFILKSTDGGLSWDNFPFSGVFMANWLELVNPQEYTWVEMSPTFVEDETVFLGPFRSNDGGLNWDKAGDKGFHLCRERGSFIFSPTFAIDHIVVAGQSGHPGIFRSVDGGETFFDIEGQTMSLVGHCPQLLVEPSSKVFLVLAEGKLLGSQTKGETWDLILQSSRKFQRMVLDVEPGTILLATSGDLFRLFIGGSLPWPILESSLFHLDTVPQSPPLTQLSRIFAHRGPGEEQSLLVARTSCPVKAKCKSTLKDHLHLSRNGGSTWQTILIEKSFANDRGHQNGTASDFHAQEFTDFVGVPSTNRIFIGTYTGIFRSDDGGMSWIELDTIARVITGLSVGSLGDGRFFISACSYMDSCFSTEIDLSNIRSSSGQGHQIMTRFLPSVLRNSIGKKLRFKGDRYRVLSVSPTFAADRLAMYSMTRQEACKVYYKPKQMPCAGSALLRMTNVSDFPLVIPVPGERVLTSKDRIYAIVFSTNFASDRTVYAVGAEPALAVSIDAGLSFTTLWNAEGLLITNLGLSPSFAVDGTMVALVKVALKYAKSGSGRSLKTCFYVSRNRGHTWTKLGQTAAWVDVAITNDKSSLVIVALNERGQLWVVNSTGGVFAPLKGSYSPRRLLGFAPNTLVTAPNGEIAAAFLEGGILLGRVAGQWFKKRHRSSQWKITASSMWSFSSDTFTAAHDKAFGHMIAFPKEWATDGIAFGASFYSIYASLDYGATWSRVARIPHRPPKICCDKDCQLEGCRG